MGKEPKVNNCNWVNSLMILNYKVLNMNTYRRVKSTIKTVDSCKLKAELP